jgi:hypothetical protein
VTEGPQKRGSMLHSASYGPCPFEICAFERAEAAIFYVDKKGARAAD